jgi:hypothetical protein
MEKSGQLHVLAAVPPGEKPSVPTAQEAAKKKILHDENRTRAVEPVAIPAPEPYFFYLVCETIGTAATPGLLCHPRVIVKMIVESRWNVDWQGKPKFSLAECHPSVSRMNVNVEGSSLTISGCFFNHRANTT